MRSTQAASFPRMSARAAVEAAAAQAQAAAAANAGHHRRWQHGHANANPAGHSGKSPYNKVLRNDFTCG